MIADKHYSPKNTARTVVKSTNRNSARRQMIANYQNHISTLDRPLPPPINTSSALQKSENCQSTVLKRVKLGSMRARNENDCSLKLNKVNDSVNSTPQNCYQIHKKDNKHNNKTKERSVKSFMIRKKNNSSYNKKEEDILRQSEIQLQDLHKIVMIEIVNNSKELDKKVYGEFSSQEIAKINPSIVHQKGNKPVSVHALQNSFNFDANKGNPTTKRIPKKIGKYFNQQSEKINEPAPSIQKRQTNSSFKCIESAINKIRIVSNVSVKEYPSESRNILQGKSDKKQNIKPRQSKQQKQNKQQRNKVHAICKTIKVPWELQPIPFNDMQNKLIKKYESHNDQEIKQDFFGGISMIPHQDKKQWIQKKESIPVQSLQEIFMELQIGEAQSISQLKTQNLLL